MQWLAMYAERAFLLAWNSFLIEQVNPPLRVKRRVLPMRCASGRCLCSTTGEHANILKIRPPLVFGSEHADPWPARSTTYCIL